jgi:signal transduction histidine kinase
MGQKETTILIWASFFAILLMCAGFTLVLVFYRNRKRNFFLEKEMINQQHQQQLLSTQLHTQSQTMQFIGREIHDNVGQKLTLASLYTKQLLNRNNTATDKINTIGNIIDESLADLRQLSKSLTSPALAAAPLAQLLQDEALRINSLGNCLVVVTDNAKDVLLQPAQKNILFRLLQEFIQNSLKHAGCRKINIELSAAANKLIVTAADDGKGFNTANISTGQGLANMQRRAEELNAAFNLQSATEKGTAIIIEMPLNQPDAI